MTDFSDEPHLITKAAVGDENKLTAERLLKSRSYVQQMTEDPEKDRYSRFIQLYLAVPDAGAELYFQDFAARHKERMLRSKPVSEAGIAESIDNFVSAAAKFLSAIFKGQGEAILKEGTKLLQILGTLMSFGRTLQNGEEESESEGSRRTPAER